MFEAFIEKLGEFVDFLTSKWHRMTSGRRGEDDFCGFLWIVGLILLIIDMFTHKKWMLVVGILCIVYGIFRCFSPLAYHEKENALFQGFLQAARGMLKTFYQFLKRNFIKFQQADKKEILSDAREKVMKEKKPEEEAAADAEQKAKAEEARKEREAKKAMKDAYYIFECPGCKQKVRIPNRGKKGRVAIVCPACKTRFVKMRW